MPSARERARRHASHGYGRGRHERFRPGLYARQTTLKGMPFGVQPRDEPRAAPSQHHQLSKSGVQNWAPPLMSVQIIRNNIRANVRAA
jgi:hypothetical protein